MKFILCVDDKNGMMFNNRRQSQDRILRQKIAEICNGTKLYLSTYSAGQFDGECELVANDNFESLAQDNDYCFIENISVDLNKADQLYLFKWNRKYPADLYFEAKPKELGLKLIKKEDFEGSSHEKITLEVYSK